MLGEGEEYGGDKSGSIMAENKILDREWFKMRLKVLSATDVIMPDSA